MTMAAKGLAKLIEECGELVAVAGKRLAYYTTDDHPDGGPSLVTRLEDEIADVCAAIALVISMNDLSEERIQSRAERKTLLFMSWNEDPDNNADGVDRGGYR